MPYKSKAQQRYLESSASPLTEEQKKEFRSKTDFGKLVERARQKKKSSGGKEAKHGNY